MEETTFNINAGESKVVTLPSTLDPAGIDYEFEEIVKGTASTSVVTPTNSSWPATLVRPSTSS